MNWNKERGCVSAENVLREMLLRFGALYTITPLFPPPFTISNVYKIVFLGEGRVGKTSCVLRYCQGLFSDSQAPTLSASHLTKRLRISNKSVTLNIWDTAGQERYFHFCFIFRYDSLGPLYYRDANGACLVYDITDPSTFQKVQKWVNELRSQLGNDVPQRRQGLIDHRAFFKPITRCTCSICSFAAC